MKILHVINHLRTGGAERLLCTLLPKLIDLGGGIQLSLAAIGDGNSSLTSQIPSSIPLHFGNCPVYSIQAFHFLRKIISIERPDIIHVHLFPSQLYVAILAKIYNIKYIITEHSTSNGRRSKKWLMPEERFVYKNSSAIAVITAATGELLVSHMRLKLPELKIIPNGINLVDIDHATPLDFEEVLEDPTKKTGKRVIITVGRLIPEKGYSYLLKIFHKTNLDLHLCIVGDGPEKFTLIEQIRELKIEDRVSLLGSRNDVFSLMKSAFCYIQPSLVEGFGLAAVEAMACGLPIIHSACPGLAETVGDAGMEISMTSAETASLQINQLAQNPERLNLLKKLSIERAKLFSIESTAENYLKLYEEVSIGPRKRSG